MVDSGISWDEITRMVKEEKKNGNILANLIHKIKFDKNSAILILDSVNEDSDIKEMNSGDDENKFTNFDPVMLVDIDLNLTA